MNAQPFGKYQLLKKLATGGMAEVWLARQAGIEGFQRLVVVKRILPHLADDPEFVQMFLNEAKIAARFNHPNIAQIYDLGEANGTYFIAMEFVHGEDLGRVMRKAWSSGQWIARPLAIRIVASACEGLYYAHGRSDENGRPLKVVHRDISPQNILISFDGSVKVVDFGIAKASNQASLTRSGAIKGKFAYMSPEQAAGKTLDHRSDIFAVGLVLYELLTGVRPLKRDTELATLQAALECAIEKPSAVADVPRELDDVVMRALAKAADDRYRDARAFQMALEEFLVGQRWVASSVQVSELMHTLFEDRLREEERLGHPDPGGDSASGTPGMPEVPADLRRTERGKPNQQKEKGAVREMSWDAPPGQRERPRPVARVRPDRREEGASRVTQPATGRSGARTGQGEPSWEAPPAEGAAAPVRPRPETREDLPPRRKTSGEKPHMAIEARSSEMTDDSLPPLAPSMPSSPRGQRPSAEGRRQSQREIPSGRPVRSEETRVAPDAVEPESEPPARPSRRSSGVARALESDLRRAPLRDAPPVREIEVAPRRRYTPEPIAAPDLDEPEGARKADAEALEARRVRSSARLQRVLWASLGLAAVAMVLLFHRQVWDALRPDPSQGQGIFLTVECNLRAKVSVRHPPEEGSPELLTFLGHAPVRQVRGAHLRDTLVLENPEIGLYYEEPIAFGEPNKHIKIQKDFVMGKLKVRITPNNVSNLSFHSLTSTTQHEVGKYVPGLQMELVEGRHLLQIRGDQLREPYEVEVFVKPRETVELPIDLAGYLQP